MATRDWERFVDVARSMSVESDFESTVQVAVDSAPHLIGGCDDAGVSIVHAKGRITTEAATRDGVSRADALQHELDDGPCVQSIRNEETVRSADLSTERRWPQWAPRVAAELGYRSMLCVQLFTAHDTFGCLNLYSVRVDGFDDDDHHAALALAAHVAVAVKAAHDVDHLESALVSRDVIGQAKGRLMERFDLTSHQAFEVLARMSQDQQVKLRVVAERLARDGWHGKG